MLKAVIIDESATTRSLLQTIILNNGWDVVGQTNANEKGLLMLQKFQPHFVCIDSQQTDTQGQLLETIRAECPKTLIFIISSALDANAVQNFISRGAHGFFLKPFNQTTVANTIRSAVLRFVKSQQANNASNAETN